MIRVQTPLVNLTADCHEKSPSLVCCSYSGNHYLRMDKRRCTSQNTNNNKLKLVLGTTLSGILTIALVLIVGVLVYRNKFGRKEHGVAIESSRVEKEPKPALDQGQY